MVHKQRVDSLAQAVGVPLGLCLVWLLGASTGLAQEPSDTPLDVTPMETAPATVPDGVAVRAGERFFSFDPYARSRGLVVSAADVALACAGAGALRDTALACPLDHQLALRGLPGLLTACAAVGRGGQLPTTATPVPHAATIHAAAQARVSSVGRVLADCTHTVDARRSGAQLQISVPAASGAVEVRVGWRAQPVRPIAGAPPPEVVWLAPAYQSEIPTAEGMVSRTVDLGAMRPDRGWWRFDLAVEIIDEAGAATRVLMPVDIEEVGAAGPVVLGPSLEVAVGSGSGTTRLADLPIPPETNDEAVVSRGRPGADRTPSAGGGRDTAALDIVLAACLRDAEGLAAHTCRRLNDGEGGVQWPTSGAGPLVGAAARDDVIGLLRSLGERVLHGESMRTERSWAATDAGLVLGALGGTLEAMVAGADPMTALAAWSRQRPPTLPTGEHFGFFSTETTIAAPLSSTLYLTSLVAASSPDPAPQGRMEGITAIAMASNLAWTDNLPGGIRAPWSGTVYPRIGEADLGWVASVATAVDTVRSAVGVRWETIRRGGAEVVAALAAVHAETLTGMLAAAASIPDQSGANLVARTRIRADLDRLLARLPDVLTRLARADLAGAADRVLALSDDPALSTYLPAPTATDLSLMGALTALGTTTDRASARPTFDRGLVGVVGALGGIELQPTASPPASLAAWPTAALAWQSRWHPGRSTLDLRVPFLDLGAPLTWRTHETAWTWASVFAPGLQVAWAPTSQSLAWTANLQGSPVLTTDGETHGAIRLGVGITHAFRP